MNAEFFVHRTAFFGSALRRQLEGRDLVSFNRRAASEFGVEASGSSINFCGVQIDGLQGNGQNRLLQLLRDDSERNSYMHEDNYTSLDDDLSTMVQQFQDNSAPNL
ncbi:uncharacterized protein LOC132045843 isoform X1 [Lycium ferocissimum]|uniref:uncharacterized protein LOC132045843 isoform X1 n=1 Tax=Lycium ferocissimum TaxID=112874 RepID=UPI002816936A|nr:uncharacterized protein LOC132045843 isoform X1 [Lycium ferocissimum]